MIGTIPFDYDTETETEHGLDKLRLMLNFIEIWESKQSKSKQAYNRLKSWLVQQLQRGITTEEEASLCQGILSYLHSEPETNERAESMDYLMNAKFLAAA